MKKIFVLIFISTLSFTNITLSQDTTETEESWHWEWEDVEEWTGWWSKKPTVSISYGFSNITREDVSKPFADNNLIELKLGYTTRKGSRYAKFLNRHKFRYLFVTNNSTKLAGGSNTTSDIETNNWRFGFARSGGYGYSVGSEASIIPYFTWSLDWTMMDFTNDSLSAEDKRVTDLYDGTFRFGSSNESGLRIQATRLISFEAGFERSIVFERHLFWKWAGSSIIEVAAHGVLDAFLNEIYKSSPEAGPVVFIILKSALGYGLYELRKDKMNWPFSSAPPVLFDNIKFSLTFVF